MESEKTMFGLETSLWSAISTVEQPARAASKMRMVVVGAISRPFEKRGKYRFMIVGLDGYPKNWIDK